MSNQVQIFTDLFCYNAYVGIHQVRIPVFNNYQRYPAGALKHFASISSHWWLKQSDVKDMVKGFNEEMHNAGVLLS